MRRSEGYGNIRRVHQILRTLMRYGFYDWVADLRVSPLLTFINRLLFFRRKPELPAPVRIRLVLEELGPTFVKFGQVLSTRADLLPPDYLEEFKKLQDRVPPFPFEKVKEVVEKELKAPLEERFSTFEEAPVASASIAQVHLATLPDGTEVAVKVKRPGIDRIIDSDISVMYTIAHLLERYVPPARRYRPREVVDEFSRVIHKEQDFTVEGANAQRFYEMFRDDPTVKIPKVFWEYTTPQVLTLERVEGIPVDEVERIKAMGLDVKKIARNGLNAFFKQVFDFGFFHADLHPGNIFTTEEGTIIYLDFGITGRIDNRLRRYLARLLYALVRRDYRTMALIHREMGLISKDVDIEEFEDALREIAEPIFGRPLEKIDISSLLLKLIRTARRFQMQLQPNLLLLQKSMVIVEGVGRQLYPELNAWEIARPMIYRWMIREKVSPRRVAERGRDAVSEISEIAMDIPRRLHTIMEQTAASDLKIGFVHYRIEELVREVGNLGDRLFLGLVILALLTSSTIMLIFKGPGDRLLSVLGWGGYLVAIAILVAGMVRMRRTE